MWDLIKAIRLPISVEIFNSIIALYIYPNSGDGSESGFLTPLLVVSWSLTLIVVFWAGWIIGRAPTYRLWKTLAVGPVIASLGLIVSVPGSFSEWDSSVEHNLRAIGGWVGEQPILAYWAIVAITTIIIVIPVLSAVSFLGSLVVRRWRLSASLS